MKQIKLEGFLDDVFSILSNEPQVKSGAGVNRMNNLLKPHTVTDLYDGVLLRLRSSNANGVVKNDVMPKFFPDKSKKTTLPKTTNKKLIALYRDKLEDHIVEFCTADANDIIKRVQQTYTQAGKDINDISGDQYFGTILQQVDTDEYDLIDNLVSTYKKFEEELKDTESWPEEAADSGESKDNSKTNNVDANRIIDNIINQTLKHNSELSGDDITSFLNSDEGMGAIAGWLAKSMGR